jgi:tripartite-type tricarboxylate transporter receptor subunit TctC
MDVLKSEQDKAAMQLLLLDSFVAWPLVGPPGMPAETLATYRKAYRAALADPQLLAEAKQLQLVIEPVTGEEIETFVKEVAASPPAVVQRARTLSGM